MSIRRLVLILLYTTCLLFPTATLAGEYVVYSCLWKGGIDAWNYQQSGQYLPLIRADSRSFFQGQARNTTRAKDFKILVQGLESYEEAVCALYRNLSKPALRKDIGRVSAEYKGKRYIVCSVSSPFGHKSLEDYHRIRNECGSAPPPQDTYYDEEEGRWRSQSFDAHWRQIMRGSASFQARMRREGCIWDEEAGGWVHPEIRLRERREQLAMQALARSHDLPMEQQEIVERIVKQIREMDDDAAAVSKMQRLRNGTHLMASAEQDRALSEVAEVEQVGIVANAVTMVCPFVNDARDIQELWTGRDMWTGQELEWWERALTALGIVAGAGATWRSLGQGGEAVADARRTVQQAGEATEEVRRSMSRVDDLLADSSKLDEMMDKVPGAHVRRRHFQNAALEGQSKAAAFKAALKSGDEKKIMEAVLEVKGDWEAIKAMNRESNFLKTHFNKRLQGVYEQVDRRVKERVTALYNRKIDMQGRPEIFTPSGQHNVSIGAGPGARGHARVETENVRVFCATNPSDKVKIGKDRDYTIRVFGQDLPTRHARRIYDQEMHKVLKEMDLLPPRIKSPGETGRWLDQTPVHWLDTEAYNKKDLNPILKKLWVRLEDPGQIALTIEHKGVELFNEAQELARHGRHLDAERHMAEGLYQIRKQFDNQVSTRIKLAREAGHQVKTPVRLEKAVRIMEKVETGQLSPAEAEVLLKNLLDYTPREVARDVGQYLQAIDTLIVSH